MQFDTRHHGDKFEAGLSERLTSADHGSFRQLLSMMEKSGSKTFVLDLARLDWIDSAGLGMLILAKEAASRAGSEFKLRGPGGHVKQLLELGRFDRLFEIEA